MRVRSVRVAAPTLATTPAVPSAKTAPASHQEKADLGHSEFLPEKRDSLLVVKKNQSGARCTQIDLPLARLFESTLNRGPWLCP